MAAHPFQERRGSFRGNHQHVHFDRLLWWTV